MSGLGMFELLILLAIGGVLLAAIVAAIIVAVSIGKGRGSKEE